MRRSLHVALILLPLLTAYAFSQSGYEYEIGGPLAGVKLPPLAWGEEGERELHPGSVEQWRGEMFRYLPIRSMFDVQSMVRKWGIDELPGSKETFSEPVYDLSDHVTRGKTGELRSPVPVVRWQTKNPVVQLDFGTLDRSMYAVRIIGAVETEQLLRFRKPLYLALKVNDGPNGEVNTYRVRSAYLDNFYSLTELFFNAPEKRHYKAELYIDEGSQVDVLVNHVSLDNVLVGSTWLPIKTKRTLHTEDEIEQIRLDSPYTKFKEHSEKIPKLTREQRLERDEAIWRWLPPINKQGAHMDFNVPVAGQEQWPVSEEMGKWELVRGETANLVPSFGWVLPYEVDRQGDFLINKKLGLKYTNEDLWAGNPLPDPFPLKDVGQGLYEPNPEDPSIGKRFAPIAQGVWRRYRAGMSSNAADFWLITENEEIGHDAAIMLVRYAYQYPSIYPWAQLDSLTCQPGARGKDFAMQQRETIERWTAYAKYLDRILVYDKLFPFIQGNQKLADSINRFVPWVKTPDDVIMLLDVYLVQHQAKRTLRYHDRTMPHGAVVYATALGDSSVTGDWMRWAFTKTWVYPLPLAGLPDLMVSGHDRAGIAAMQGSWHYAMGQNAIASAAPILRYLQAGGSREFDITDPTRFPKIQALPVWALETSIAGRDFPRIGDVAGPEKQVGKSLHLHSADNNLRAGWEFTKQPRFAWLMKHLLGRQNETDEQWNEVEQAAAKVDRMPQLDLHSRFIPNWFSILEVGHEHDDYRLRRAAYVRTGVGVAHAHNDTLDLQIFAHGLPMTIDDGQRSGYSKPNSRFTRQHNTVEVEGGNHELGTRAEAYAATLADNPGAPYQNLIVSESRNRASHMQRQVALIDVDSVSDSPSQSIEQQLDKISLPPLTDTADSYVFDVFRVEGGSMHSYGFHGPIDDEMTWNALGVQPVKQVKPTNKSFISESDFLSVFESVPEAKLAGDVPTDGILQATWRMSRDDRVGEAAHLGKSFDEASPRKFTRLHLLAGGERALQAKVVCHKINYSFTHLMARRTGENLSTAFIALVEPYVGEPFIESRKLLPIANNESDALQAVAVGVTTTNGNRDLIFADGRPEKNRMVIANNARLTMQGEFAYLSLNSEGLRQATLTGGEKLNTPQIRIDTKASNHSANIVAADYANMTITLDKAWPASDTRKTITISRDGGYTTYTVVRTERMPGGRTRLHLLRGADFYRSQLRQLDETGNQATGSLFHAAVRDGARKLGYSISDEPITWQRPASFVSANTLQVQGEPLSASDFGEDGIIRVWEYGPGHQVESTTTVSLQEVAPNVYKLTANVDCEISLPARSVKISTDRNTWKFVDATPLNGWVTVTVAAEQAIDQPVYVQVSAD